MLLRHGRMLYSGRAITKPEYNAWLEKEAIEELDLRCRANLDHFYGEGEGGPELREGGYRIREVDY